MKRAIVVLALLFAVPAFATDAVVDPGSFTTATTNQTSCDCQDMLQWHLDYTHAREAWLTHTGIQSFKVAVISTGIDTACYELGGAGIPGVNGDPNTTQSLMWKNPNEVYNNIDDDNNGFIDDVRGWNFSGTSNPSGISNNVNDIGVTGTAFATTMAAAGPEMNYRGVGIAPKITVVPVKWYDGGFVGVAEAQASAMNYARTKAGCKIMFVHGGTNLRFQPVLDQIAANTAAGILTIWSAGGGVSQSNNIDECPDSCLTGPAWPMKSTDPGLLVVNACTLQNYAGPQDAIIPNGIAWGPQSVDLSAPVIDANVPLLGNPRFYVGTTGLNEGWGYWNGTSNAAASMVCGAAALVWGAHPTFTVAQVKSIIMATATANQYPGLAGKTVTGGMLNVNRAVDYADSLAGGGEIESMEPTREEPQKQTTIMFSVSQAKGMVEKGTKFYDISGRLVREPKPGVYFVDKRRVLVTR